MQKGESEKSVVGDPVFWPGLIYAPLNLTGLIFALGSITNITGLIFEEFSESGRVAVCRRRTERGWERIKAALAVRSSEYANSADDIDLLICWIDDSGDADKPPVMELSAIGSAAPGPPGKVTRDIDRPGRGIPSEESEEDDGDKQYGEFEETIRLLDEKIKKFKSG